MMVADVVVEINSDNDIAKSIENKNVSVQPDCCQFWLHLVPRNYATKKKFNSNKQTELMKC